MQKHKPNWWMLYALVPLAMILLIAEAQLPGSTVEHGILEAGIVLGIFGAMVLWLHANQSALIEREYEHDLVIHVYDPTLETRQEVNALPSADCSEDSRNVHDAQKATSRLDLLDWSTHISRNN